MKKILLLVIPALFLGACAKNSVINLSSPAQLDLPAEENLGTIHISPSMEWTAECDRPWIQLNPSSGTVSEAGTVIDYHCEANESTYQREATVTILAGEETRTVSIHQNPVVGIALPESVYYVTKPDKTLTIKASSRAPFNISIDVPWITIESSYTTSFQFIGDIKIKVGYNPIPGEAREGHITFFPYVGKDRTVTVIQAVAAGSFTVSSDGGTLNADVETKTDFDVLPESDWVHYVETKSSAKKTIVFTIDRNPASTSRETFVLLKPKEGNQARCLYIGQYGRK